MTLRALSPPKSHPKLPQSESTRLPGESKAPPVDSTPKSGSSQFWVGLLKKLKEKNNNSSPDRESKS